MSWECSASSPRPGGHCAGRPADSRPTTIQLYRKPGERAINMNPLDILNPIFFVIILIALVAALIPAKQSARKITAVLAGCLAGYGVGAAVNALSMNIFSWLTSAHILRSGAMLSTGDIMTGLMVAGSGLGLLAAMFIREPMPLAPPQPVPANDMEDVA